MKKIALGFATCGLILSSCSSNDVFEDNQGTNNPNAINFSATTTRATVNTLNEVKGGFPVYAVTTKTALDWHIQGAIYEHKDGSWLWRSDAQKWPTLDKFPMNFYAYYPAVRKTDSDAVYEPKPDATNVVNTLKATITIGSKAEYQEDYLAANTTGITRPMATVPLQFKHITTKINFGVIAADGTKSYVQQMNINNVKNQGTYDYVATGNNWSYTTNDGFNTDVLNKYDYFETPGVTADKVKDVKQFTFDSENPAQPFYPFTPTGSTEIKAEKAHLMLLPQAETAVWTPEKYTGTETAVSDNQTNSDKNTPAGLTITPLYAYIGSVYRMDDGNGKDLVGYSDASKHPNYNDLPEGSEWEKYTGPLFVKVGFPLATGDDSKFSWAMGKGYTYNIVLGEYNSSGGYILDNRYYDKYGNPTDLTIDGKNPGDPVLGGDIHFHVTVENWGDDESTDIEGPQSQS